MLGKKLKKPRPFITLRTESDCVWQHQPVNPVCPGTPRTPATPSTPGCPITPFGPEAPVNPVKPVKPSLPVKPKTPPNPGAPVQNDIDNERCNCERSGRVRISMHRWPNIMSALGRHLRLLIRKDGLIDAKR